MKIAYCLVGIVGASDYGMGIGKDIDYRLAYYWNKKNIFDVNNDVDVFIHSWSVEHEEGINSIYKPKKSSFEPQIDFNLDNVRDNCIASRWYSTAMCNQLRKEYEEEKGIKYDAVMFFRLDHVFLTPLKLSEFDMNYIWFRHRRPVGWADGVRQSDNESKSIDTTTQVDLSTYELRRKFNLHPNDRVYDSFIFSKPEHIDAYASVYDYLIEVDSTINSPHEEIPNHLKRNNIWDKADFCFFGEIDTEAIRALYKNPELTEKSFNISNFERFENKYVRQNPEVIKRFKSPPLVNKIDIINLGFNNSKKIQ